MSSNAPPITPARFAAALPDLPLSSLHAKAAELRNSITHLEASNDQLRPFADEGDADCAEAIRENEEVIRRMRDRIALLKAEVEGRGFLWDNGATDINGKEPGEEDVDMVNGDATSGAGSRGVNGRVERAGRGGGSLGDEELARRLRERMEVDEEEGLHL
ncbi:hypothetical protein MMC17_006890 [Xylographa soralifera]|nr:hypothetical protein [Xylographa soralifera]MCJ1383776.1 hypothetical protein [Xylographa soralifera]